MAIHALDSVRWYLEELGARVVAESGIASDRYHFGKITLHSLKEYPDFVLQIDGATGESETFKSALDRSVRCAVALRSLGMQTSDVMVLMAPNHIHLCIPHHAALYLGMKIAPVDYTLGVQELHETFDIIKPSIIFCQSQKAGDVDEALRLAQSGARVVIFNDGSHHTTFAEFIKNVNESDVHDFKPSDFNAEEEIVYLTPTSGTTGTPKAAALTHKNFMFSLATFWLSFSKFPCPTRLMLVLSPLQWLSAISQFLISPILKFTRLQTSAPITVDHYTELVNKYRPSYQLLSPPMMISMMTAEGKCDFTCFECVLLGGSAVLPELIAEVKRLTKSPTYGVYGLSEIGGICFNSVCDPPTGSQGKPLGHYEYRLVDLETNKDVVDANIPGELWLRGPTVFKGYYNNPEVTAETVTDDGWLKTGDIFYRDEHWNFYFVERRKLLLKYRNHQVSPLEVESVILKHPGVLNVAVTGIPDAACGDLVVACVVPRAGCQPTAQEIKDLVKEKLTETKQLHGGVIFLKQLPLTSTSKINRKALSQLAETMPRE